MIFNIVHQVLHSVQRANCGTQLLSSPQLSWAKLSRSSIKLVLEKPCRNGPLFVNLFTNMQEDVYPDWVLGYCNK